MTPNNQMRPSRLLNYICAVILFTLFSKVYAAQVPIYIRNDVFNDYIEFLNDRNVINIEDYSGKNARRDVADIIIALQSLHLGGFKHNFDISSGNVNFRNTKMLQSGELLISLDSYWLTDAKAIEQDVYISSPVIRQGEYVAGVYTSPNNVKTLATQRLTDFHKLTGVSTPKWRTDWETMTSLNLAELIQEDQWISMARLVSQGWVDFMLMPFHQDTKQDYKIYKVHLVPVPNIAIMLNGSRHFVVSKHHPLGESSIKALEKGMAILRQQGRIKKAYIQAGFFVDTKEVNILNK
ncbi:hypothetical protein [Psychrosphaera sp. F3M07]|uniref:hypothetical protein n=1 Tax=Psychrosphaera sp. F3M07 TaxID=2841560 RepID=UPI0020909DC7|nr:hypothetical protein [Psychrosphaera sp. F3M07]